MPLLSITQNLSDDQIIERLSKDLLLLQQQQKQSRKKATATATATSIAIFGERTITSEVANAFVNYFHTCGCDDDFVDYFQTCCDGWCASASATDNDHDGVESSSSTSSSTCLLSSSGQQQQQQQQQQIERLNSQERRRQRQRQRRRPRRRKKRRRLFTELDLYCISRNEHFDRIIQTAIQLDLFAKIHIKGTRVSSNNNNNIVRYIQPSLQVLHDKLQTTKHLHTLQLSYLDLKQHDTIVLKQALSKQHCSLEQLLFTNVHFVVNVVISNDSSLQQQQQESDHHHEEMNDVNNTTDTTTTTIMNPSSLQEFINGLNSNTSLKVLALNSCNLNDNDIADIINNGIQCHPTLTQLRLHGNSCRSKGCLSIAKMLSKPNNCKLEILLLHHQFKTTTTTTTSNNNNNNNNISEEEEASTTTTRDEINNGQNLVLSTIGLSNLVSKEGWQQQQQQSESESGGGGGGGGGSTKNKTSSSSMIIYRNTSLKKLVLSGNRLRDDDMFSIVHLLRRCINLEELDLDTNYITNDGLKILAENTISNYNLRVLRLSENPIIITQSQQQPTMLLTTNAQPPPHFNPTTVRVRVPPVVSSSPSSSSSQNNQLSTTSKTLYYAKKLLEIHPRLCVLSIGRSHWQWSSSSTTTTTTTAKNSIKVEEEEENNNNRLIQQIVHLLDCNRAGRILFTSTTASTTIGQQHPKHPKQSLKKRPLPMSVWPIVLSNINFASPWNWRGSRYTKQNQIYYLLRHGPILMEQRCYEDKKDNDESNCGRISRGNNSDNNSVVIVDDNNGGSSRISRAAAVPAAGLKRERQQPEDGDDETTMMKPTNNHHQKKRKAEKSDY